MARRRPAAAQREQRKKQGMAGPKKKHYGHGRFLSNFADAQRKHDPAAS
jgi:hypothetical protein